jgi:uncharacterized Zn finger protein
MPGSLLPIRCPKCAQDEVRLYVSSTSVLTVQCPECGFTWAIDVASLPTATKDKIADALRH